MNAADGSARRVSLFIPSLRGGGVERQFLHLAGAFVERGLDVDLVLAEAVGPNLAYVPSRVHVVDLGASRVALSVFGLAAHLRRRRPDVLLAGMAHANVMAVAARALARVEVRIVLTNHNLMRQAPDYSPRRRDRWVLPLAARAYRRADAIICVSGGVAADVSAVTGIPRELMHVVPNAVPPPPAPETLPGDAHPWLLERERPLVVALGRLVPEKGFDVLIDAFAALPREGGPRLLIFGDGRQRDELERRVAEHGLGDVVSLPGYVDDPGPVLARADLLAAPSRIEGFGNVIVEAMARGTRVVVSDCPGGPREIVAEGRLGTIVPVGDAMSLARALRETLAAPERSRELIEASATYRPERVASRYLEVMFDGD